MRAGVATGVCWAILALASTLPVSGQSTRASGSAPLAVSSSFENGNAASALEAAGQVYREIDDPNTGDRWLLMRDPSHPGGPGRLVRTEKPDAAQGSANVSRAAGSTELNSETQLPVIHTGDRLIVERDTKTVEERLEAVALGPATIGSHFDVRLKIGGKVLRAEALGQGRAAFAAESGATQ